MEQTLVGSAAGFALRGRVPIVHALACFITLRAYEFARTDIGAPKMNVKLVGSFPGFMSTANGFTHQAVDDIGVMSSIPNMNIFAPADNEDLLIGMPKVIESESPFYIRFNDSPAIIEHKKDFQIGKAEIIKEGSDVSILVYGILLKEAIKASQILENNGVSAEVVNMRTVKPLDEEMILNSLQNKKLTVTFEDHFEFGGLYHQIALLVTKNRLKSNILPINLKDRFFKPAMMEDILQYEGFRGEDVANKILSELK
jgi:transketolase